MGLNITLQSYNGWLDFGLISCQKLMPDIHELAQHMKAANKELLKLTLSAHAEAPKLESKTPSKIEGKTQSKIESQIEVKSQAKVKAKASQNGARTND
jgi:hypothetical protein